MPSTKNIVKRTGSWRCSGEPRGGFVALFVHSSCCPHDYMRMFHNNAGFLGLQIIFVFKLVFQRLGVWGGWTSMAGWKCGRCPALWSVLYGLGGAVLHGYGILVLECLSRRDQVLREAGGMRVERTLMRMRVSV
jgi:hypothetical protein